MHIPRFALILFLWRLTLLLLTNAGHHEFSNVADNGTYSCSELQKWSKVEKHYSNDRSKSFFQMMESDKCAAAPVMTLSSVRYSQSSENNFFSPLKDGSCTSHDKNAIIFLSSFSINHNFSHFLHGVLRLFCALMDAHFIVWDDVSNAFVAAVDYVIWIDENFKTSPQILKWLGALGQIRQLSSLRNNRDCVSADRLVYGSGCVKLLPPEKWYGYPGCRADKVSSSSSSLVSSPPLPYSSSFLFLHSFLININHTYLHTHTNILT
jgi:hypothetical protein